MLCGRHGSVRGSGDQNDLNSHLKKPAAIYSPAIAYSTRANERFWQSFGSVQLMITFSVSHGSRTSDILNHYSYSQLSQSQLVYYPHIHSHFGLYYCYPTSIAEFLEPSWPESIAPCLSLNLYHFIAVWRLRR